MSNTAIGSPTGNAALYLGIAAQLRESSMRGVSGSSQTRTSLTPRIPVPQIKESTTRLLRATSGVCQRYGLSAQSILRSLFSTCPLPSEISIAVVKPSASSASRRSGTAASSSSTACSSTSCVVLPPVSLQPSHAPLLSGVAHSQLLCLSQPST